MRAAPAMIVGAAGLLLTACQAAPRAEPAPAPTPTPAQQEAVREAPADLHDLAGELLRYRAVHHTLPESLEALRVAADLDPQRFEHLDAYAYHPRDLGILPSGQRLIAVDTAVRIQGYLWCIVMDTAAPSATTSLEVQLVPLKTLEAVARQGNRPR